MPEVIGHWDTLEEAQKLTQSQLIPGVIEEDIKIGNILDRIPVALALGKTIKWNREKVVADAAIAGVDIGEALSWASDMQYDDQEATLKRKYVQRRLDHFIPDVYGTIQNYEAQVLWEMKKAMYRRLGEDLIYDDLTYGGVKEFDGLHSMAAIQTGSDLDIDNGEVGLSLHYLRKLLKAMKHGCDAIYMPDCIATRVTEAYEERGFAGLAYNVAGPLAAISKTTDDIGKAILKFDNVPIVPSDFLEAENANTGEGSNLRAKHNTGTANYSIFGIKFGDVFKQQPGITFGFGNPDMLKQLYKLVYFPDLEDYDAAGLRLITYNAPLLGSKLCIGRIFDVTDVAITI